MNYNMDSLCEMHTVSSYLMMCDVMDYKLIILITSAV